jgi:hypothetical protein
MNIFEQLEKIDEYIEKRKYQDAEDILLAGGMSSGIGLGFTGSHPVFAEQVPWMHNNPLDMQRDSDLDGIPDALDYHRGPGAFENEH